MKDKFERHKQPWTAAEIDKLHTLARKGVALKAIAKALTRGESVKARQAGRAVDRKAALTADDRCPL